MKTRIYIITILVALNLFTYFYINLINTVYAYRSKDILPIHESEEPKALRIRTVARAIGRCEGVARWHNNPGGIMCLNGLCNYQSMEAGYIVLTRVVQRYIDRGNSIQSMSHKYTETEQDTWAKCVSKIAKISLTQSL